jgi:transposase
MSDRRRRVRVTEPFRDQGFLFGFHGDGLPEDHPARILDAVIGKLDLSEFTAGAKAVEGTPGRPVLSPRMMLTLWLYAFSVGIGSAREIARLVLTDAAFRWIVGDCRVSHQALSAFRVGHVEAVDELFTQVLSVLMHKGLVCLAVVAQDGTRVRASATAPSFRSAASLEECRQQAALHLKAVRAAADAGEASGAAVGAARDLARRVDEALEVVRQMRPRKNSKGQEIKPRASTTDPDARVMKMPDGGFRPGYNVQFAVAGDEHGGPRTIVGVNVTNSGSDLGSVAPMVKQIHERTGVRPGALLADGGHAKLDDIRELDRQGIKALISVPERSRAAGENADHSREIDEWRRRMQDPNCVQLYRARAGLVELVNAHFKEHFGIKNVLVRGIEKVTCVALLGAVAFNLLQHAGGLLS